MSKPRYLSHGWSFIHQAFKKHIDCFDFDYVDVENHKVHFEVEDYLFMRRLYRRKVIQKYQVFHDNHWESYTLMRKTPGQFSIVESHGPHPGFKMQQLYSHRYTPKYKHFLGIAVETAIGRKVLRALRACDMYYVSTPDLLDYAKESVREDSLWLPNAVDTDVFCAAGKKAELAGDPAVFMPTRIDGGKMAEIGINLFNDHIRKDFPKAHLHLIQGHLNAHLERQMRKRLANPAVYTWHNFMPQDRLASYYRGSDLVLGQFKSAAFGLNELQAMACGSPLLSYSEYGLKISIDEMPDLALKILSDKRYKRKFAGIQQEYMRKTHYPEAVSSAHLKNMSDMGYKF